MTDREALIRETHRLKREIGYTGFRLQYFNDPDAIKEWPDPAMRERELRSFWDKLGEESYPAYRADAMTLSTKSLAACRDRLAAKLAGSKLDHVDYYHRAVDYGRRARFQNQDKGKELER
jgi:hypothetical protein